MISITHFGSGKAAKDYFSEHLSKGDYFAKDAEILQPRFEGLTSKMLGIEGKPVDQKSFFALVDNTHPVTGEKLSPRTRSDRRAMTDITFSEPKSVTLAGLVDSRIESARDMALRQTMDDIEKEVGTRVRRNDADHDRRTGNLAYVIWPHETTRPLADGTVDPMSHRHVTCFNFTYDPAEGRLKAAQFGSIVRDKGYYQAAYHARLAEKLSQLGYGVEREQKSFRLMGIDKATCEKFSRRTTVIEDKAKALGIVDPEAKADLGRKTRNRKGDELGSDELTRGWIARLTPKELTALERAGAGIHKGKVTTAKEAMDYAVEHSFERKSVISEKALLAEALVHGVGSVTVAGVHSQFPNVIRKDRGGVTYVTTKAVYEEELVMVAFARDGKGKCARLATRSAQAPETLVLSAEQELAKERILSSRDRVTILVGGAGTGKTRMMQSTVKAIETAGTKVHTFAPSADASRGVLRSEGFANADTVERLLTDRSLQRETAGRVLWIDEAGLLSSKDLNRVFKLAKRNNNRVILSGDTKQHRAVARGDGLRIIENEAGLKAATLTEIRRQKNEVYRSAVADISRGETLAGIDGVSNKRGRKASETFFERGFKKLDAAGAIVECEGDERYRNIANDYLAAGQSSALVVTPTHTESAKVTERIREGLKAQGGLRGKEEIISTLYGVNFTLAERKDPLNYTPGMIVQFHQNVKGFRRGDRAEITARTVDGATVNCNGRVAQLPFDQAERFQVYQKSTIAVAPGESIRITQNGRLKCDGKEFRPNNGTVYKVAGFTKSGDLRLSNGQLLPKDYCHLTYGYSTTSHASQGKTVDRVYIAMSQDSLSAANREQFYVAVSRGRESVRIYTDDKQAVFEAVQKSGARMSAMELLGKPEKVVDMNRVRRVYNAIKERTERAITNLKERVHEQRRRA